MGSVRSSVVMCSLGAVLACVPEPPRGEPGRRTNELPVSNAVAARERIEAANARYVAALMSADEPGMTARYSDDAVIVMPGGPEWIGREQIRKGARALLSHARFTSAAMVTDEVIISGDLAVERGTGSWTFATPAGEPVHERFRHLTVWRRQLDGSLRIIRDMSTPDRTGAPSNGDSAVRR